MEKIIQKFQEKKNIQSDIHEHLETFKRYAEECDTICEMGVRGIVSTWGFLAGKPKKLTSIDFQDPSIFGGNIEEVKNACAENNIEYEFILGNTLELDIEPCDLLFLDTWHDYQQLRMELYRHHKNVKKYIIFHDTNSFSFHNEDFYELYDQGRPESNLPKGLIPAIDEFVFSNPQWYIYERFANNNGITILKRK